MISEEKIKLIKTVKEIYDETKNISEELARGYNKEIENPEAITVKVGRLTGVVGMFCIKNPEEFSKVMYVLQMLYQAGIIMVRD